MLTQARLKEVLHYDPETGLFRWKMKYPRAKAIAGSKGKDGETIIKIDYVKYRANRLAYLYMFGNWPVHEVDHKDTDNTNNALVNLRPARRSQNQANTHASKRNKSGFKGVTTHKRGFVARIGVNKKTIYLGLFYTPAEAHAAYVQAANLCFGEFARSA